VHTKKKTKITIWAAFAYNLKQVLRYNKTEGGSIEMKNGNVVPLSKYAKDEFLQKMML